MDLENCEKGMIVAYVPPYVDEVMTHKDVEIGVISSRNDRYVFIKFVRQIAEFGWTGAASQACSSKNLKCCG